MKIYIDFLKQAITKTEADTLYQGDVGSNEFNLLFFNYGNNTSNWFPTMSQLAPNGRSAGDFEADALEDDESHEYIEDGVTYLRYVFTMSEHWVKMRGRSNFYIWVNTVTPTTRKCVGKVNVMINESTNNYFIDNPYFNPAVKDYIDEVTDGISEDLQTAFNDYKSDIDEEVEAQNTTIASLSQASPSVFDTASNITNLTENKGVAVATDTGYIYYWDSTLTTPAYVSSGLQYNSLSDYVKHSGSQLKDSNGNNFYPNIEDITPNKTTFFSLQDNYKKIITAEYSKTDDYFIMPNGTIASNSDYCYTEFIDILPNCTFEETLHINGYRGIIFYDKSQNYISGQTIDNSHTTATAPNNAYYMRLSFAKQSYSVYFIINTANYKLSKRYILVAKDNADYNTITEAVNNANDGDIIFVKNGVYDNEIIKCWGKEINIIGESRNQVIISNSTGAYSTPPIEMGAGSLQNLTIIAYKNDSYSGTTDYAVHVEDNNLANKSLLIQNCTLKSEVNSALGMGMRGGCKVEFKDCHFESDTNASLFTHDASNSAYAGVQELWIEDCKFFRTGAGAWSVVRLDSQEVEGTTVYLTMVDNTFRITTNPSATTGTNFINAVQQTSSSTVDGLTNWNLTNYSIGNTFPVFNK